MTDFLKKFWSRLSNIFTPTPLGKCSAEQPMYCPTAELERLFQKPSLPIAKIINSGQRSIDVSTLTIHNDAYWKGFYATDSPIPSWIFQTGFTKRFWQQNGMTMGVTSTFDDNIRAQNKLGSVNSNNAEEGILLEYTDPQYALFYDILKIISDDIIIGKAFTGKFPNGIRLLTFSMARKYGFDFMTVTDHKDLFDNYGKVPDPKQVAGNWEGRMVCNSSLTPPLFRFRYDLDSSGRVSCNWSFMEILKGDAKIEFTEDQMLMLDFTNFHDEIRTVTPDVMVGRYGSIGQRILDLIGDRSLGLLQFEKTAEGTRPCLYYYIRRTS